MSYYFALCEASTMNLKGALEGCVVETLVRGRLQNQTHSQVSSVYNNEC
jgi:hypothetical protein